MIELPLSFIHLPPEGYSYEVLPHKGNIIGIWSNSTYRFLCCNGMPSHCIWGFYNTRTEQYLAPINSTKPGNPVDIHKTTPYSAMVRNLNPLEMVLYG
jgi:hypothetical protein